MKHFIRIAITIVVLVAVGFTSYFLFFKPDDDLMTFNKLSNTIEKREKLGVDSKLNALYSFNGHGTKNVKYHKAKLATEGQTTGVVTASGNNYVIVTQNYSTPANSETYFSFDDSVDSYADILELRSYLFNNGIPSVSVGETNMADNNGIKVYTYVAIEEVLNDIFDYYFAYSQVISGAKKSDQKSTNKVINEYNKALASFSSQIESVYDYQKAFNFDVDGETKYQYFSEITDEPEFVLLKEYKDYDITTNSAGKFELTTRYTKLINSYRSLLLKECKLIEQLKFMVTKYVFGGENIIETSTVKMDLALYSIEYAVDGDYDSNTLSHLKNASQFISIFAGLSGYQKGETADTVLERYNNVATYAKADLLKVLGLTNIEINDVADNSTKVDEILSTLNKTYVGDIQKILKAYGFGTGV